MVRKLEGHYAYYGITGNGPSLNQAGTEAVKLWHKWLRQRSRAPGLRVNAEGRRKNAEIVKTKQKLRKQKAEIRSHSFGHTPLPVSTLLIRLLAKIEKP